MKKQSIKRLDFHLRKVCISFIIAALFLGFVRAAEVGITDFRMFGIPVLFLLIFIVVLPFAETIEQCLKQPFDLQDEHWGGEEGQKEKWTSFYRYFGVFSLYFLTHLAIFSLSENHLLVKQNEDMPIYIVLSVCSSMFITWIFGKTVHTRENN